MNNDKLSFENIKENDELPAFDLTVNRTHIVKYAGAGGDFFPIHHDEEFAKSVGLPSVFAMGLMHGSMLQKVITSWSGADSIKRYKLRFKAMVWPKDILTFSGKVKVKYKEGKEHLVECSLQILNQRGEQVIEGEATVILK